MGMYDMDWIIILFVMYLDAFRVERIEGINLEGHLMVGPSLENWGLKPSRSILRNKMAFLGVKLS
jgi:hypothetical protein